MYESGKGGNEAITEMIRAMCEMCNIPVARIQGENGAWNKVYLENKSDKALLFSSDDATVNGFAADPFWATTVAAGKTAFDEISWSSSDFESSGITDVETITMIIHVREDDDWLADYIINDTYTVNP